ncbi:MAG: hypothetical protein EU521_01740 [Promethearchaeota archaeon]|nr:MAG: hypothetical protein EU521_01740 [Candidatus Lokiarchaeota archaeon]
MSKVKKKKTIYDSKITKEDIKFEKIIQFSGYIFLIALILFVGAWILLDLLLNVIEIELNASSYAIILFTGINSAMSFGLASKISEDRKEKKKLYFDWLIGVFLISMMAIFAVSVYQW